MENPDQVTTLTDQAAHIEAAVENNRFFTVPTTFMTLPRLAASAAIPYRAIQGESTAAITVGAALTDFESPVADTVDKHFPGWGRSVPGARLDYGTDAAMVAGTSVADIFGRNSHPLTRLAGTVTAFRVGSQAKLARPAMREYKKLTGEQLNIKVSMLGKIATYATLVATGASAISRDIVPNTPKKRSLRRGLAATGLGFAVTGAAIGHFSNKQNAIKFEAKLAEARAAAEAA